MPESLRPVNKLFTPFVLAVTFFALSALSYGQSGPDIVSTAPVKYRVNEADGHTLHGYYAKTYKLSIFGNASAIGYRADCDEDDDWSGAVAHGTTQSGNNFEGKYGVVFNPHELFGTVLPGNQAGQNHYDAVRELGTRTGDLTLTYKVDANGGILETVLGVVFDLGPHNQPGESSVAARKALKVTTDGSAFVYILFPNSRKYLEQQIGMNSAGNRLTRSPTNVDFQKAFELMKTKEGADFTKRETVRSQITVYLASQPMISDFDNPTRQEKLEGRKKQKNNERNSN